MWRASPKYRWRGFKFSPAVTPDALYIGDRVGFFYARRADDGSPLWEFWAGRSNTLSAPAVAAGKEVYFPTVGGRLYAMDSKDGRRLWTLQLGAPINVGPVYAAGLLLVRTEDGKLHAVE